MRHHGSYCCDGHLRSWNIFCCFIKCLFKLFIGNLFIICVFHELFKLSCGLFSSLHGIYCLYCMPWRVILRHYKLECSDRCLCSGLLLCCIFNYLLKLCIGNTFIVCIFYQLFKLSCWLFSIIDWISSLYSL